MSSKGRKIDWRIIGMIVVPIAVALIGLIPTIIEITSRQTTPTQPPSDKPGVYDFSACALPCNGANATTVFDPGTKIIYTQWNYRNIPVGATYVRAWTMNGKEWIKYTCDWPGPTDGKDVINLTEPQGLRSGVWEMTISINGVVQLREKVQVEGEEYFWEPVGTVESCY